MWYNINRYMKPPKPSYVLKLRREIKAMKRANKIDAEYTRIVKTLKDVPSSDNKEWIDSFEKLPYIDKP